ncbi:MAG: PASTA domain-containing protein, partial [Bacteroidota bacterium]
MADRKKKLLKKLKVPAIVLGIVLILSFLVDSVVMPRYVQQGKTTKVPDVIGKELDDGIQVLAESGLVGKKADVRTDKQYPEGTVVLQNPPADAEVKFGRGVYLTVSGGEPMAAVPGLRGRTLRDATFALERFGLALGEIRYEFSDEYPQGTIIDQSVAESTRVIIGRSISVVVSQGKSGEQVPVPDVVRKTFAEAERTLIQAGLRIGNITYQVNADLLPNTVIDQFPKPGDLVPTGQAVDLVVA